MLLLLTTFTQRSLTVLWLSPKPRLWRILRRSSNFRNPAPAELRWINTWMWMWICHSGSLHKLLVKDWAGNDEMNVFWLCTCLESFTFIDSLHHHHPILGPSRPQKLDFSVNLNCKMIVLNQEAHALCNYTVPVLSKYWKASVRRPLSVSVGFISWPPAPLTASKAVTPELWLGIFWDGWILSFASVCLVDSALPPSTWNGYNVVQFT